MARPPRSLDEVTRNIEQTLIPQRERDPPEPAAVGASDDTPPNQASSNDSSSKDTASNDAAANNHAERTTANQWPGSEAARPLSEIYTNAAAEIQGTGENVVQLANEIAAETRALADLLRKHGALIAERVDEFTTMTKRVASAVQKSRGEMLGQEANTPPASRSSRSG
jgi:hypothetical protein